MSPLRKHVAHLFAVATFILAMDGQAAAAELPSKVVDMVLNAGGWGPHEDDVEQRERLPLDLVRQLINGYPSDKRSIGLLALTLSAAKWGVADNGSLPSDPAEDDWRGPTRSSGKHLMSYLIGGVGLPHLDVTPLAKFIDYLVTKHEDIGPVSEQAKMTRLANGLRSGKKYDQIKSNATFRKWMLEGLRRKAAQQWILEYWLDTYWEPAYSASGEDVRLALVLARIWNTSPRLGQCAAGRTNGAKDRVQAALQAYIDCPGGRAAYKDRRWGWMKRPVVLFDAYFGKPPIK